MTQTQSKPIENTRFPIVGIGASAGGFDALHRLLEAMPNEPNIAIVIVQHLARDKPSLAPELLAKYTSMEVRQVLDEPVVRRNCVYIIPPGKYLGIEGGRLKLSPIEGPRQAPIAIDYFFRMLAKDQRQCAVGVILSGTGTDGTLGIKAIKEEGGFVIAQDTDTAEYSEMPTNAIESGMVDQILPPESIPEALIRFTEHDYIFDVTPSESDAESEPVSGSVDDELVVQSLDSIISLLRKHGDRDFRSYKQATLLRRTRRRMCLHHIDRMDDYLAHLKQNPLEIKALAKDLLISVTDFFRDAEVWEELAAKVLPEIVESKCVKGSTDQKRDTEQTVRVWIPGCATGEEAYSIAMLLLDEMNQQRKACKLQVFASDIDADALHYARLGRYPTSIEADVSRERLKRYFVLHDGELHYQVNKVLREVVVFADQNLIADPPFSQLDLICCRNVLIYLKPEMQQKVIALFHFALNPNGYLMLGTAETIGRHDDLFEMVSKRSRIFRRIGSTLSGGIEVPIASTSLRRQVSPLPPPPRRETRLTQFAQKKLLDIVAPSAVLIDRHWRIHYVSGDVSPYMTLAPGVPNHDLLSKLRDGLRSRLRGAVHKAFAERKGAMVHCQMESGANKTDVRIEVRLVREPDADDDFVLVVFAGGGGTTAESLSTDALTSQSKPMFSQDCADLIESEVDDESVIRQLEEELAATKDELQGTIEQFEVSHEGYKAANEEVMSINEELQSTNEELETSKEELQSLNEELATVNHQLASKVEQLETKHADLENLVSATEVATICLDTDLTIRWFTPAAQALVRVKVSDHGRPLGDLSNDFLVQNLSDECEQVLKRLIPIESEIACSDDRTFIRRVVPYRTDDHRIGGVVITMLDITSRKLREEELRASEERLRRALSVDGIAVMFFESSGTLVDCNDWFLETMGYSRSEVQSRSLTAIGITPPEWFDETASQLDTLQRTGRLGPYEKELFRKDGSRMWMMLSGCSQEDGTHVVHGIDIDQRKIAEQQLRELNETLETKVTQRTELLSILQFVTRIANESRSVEEAMKATLERIATYNGWLVGHAWRRVNDGSNEMESTGLWYVRDQVDPAIGPLAEFRERISQTEFPRGQGLVGLVMETGEPQWVGNMTGQWEASEFSELGLHAAIAFPITIDGEVVAVMEFWSEEVGMLQPELLEIIPDVGIQLGHIVARKRMDRLASVIALAEQQRIGHELHDGIAQQLTGGAMIAATLKRSLPPDMLSQHENVDHLREILKQTHQDVRQLASGLIPSEIESVDLLPAIVGLAAETTARHQIECKVDDSGWREGFITCDTVAFIVFQIAREAVHNAVKHAHATRIEIKLAMSNDFCMVVRDDGTGMGNVQPHPTGTNGLRIMHYRAESLGGRVEIESGSGAGTAVILTIPQRSCQT